MGQGQSWGTVTVSARLASETWSKAKAGAQYSFSQVTRVFHGGQKRTIRYDILFPVYIRNFFREDSAFKNNS